MGLFSNIFFLGCGTAFGVYLAQNYDIPDIKTSTDFLVAKAKDLEKTFRRDD